MKIILKNLEMAIPASLIAILMFLYAVSAYAQIPPVKDSVIKLRNTAPSLSVQDENGKQFSLKVSKLIIDVKVVGKLAVTTMDITFKSEFPRILEGELNFPLAEGQNVSRFAMELNGKLREGVVVEKAKGREVFENVVRQKIDPALLEMTVGNSFRSRVYPIPANGEKRVVLAYEEVLPETSDGMTYRLPLQFKDKLSIFKLAIKVFDDYKIINTPQNELKDLKFQKNGSTYATAVEYRDYTADRQIEFSLVSPENNKNILIETIGQKTYFSINLNLDSQAKNKSFPRTLCILWDVSSSCKNRDKARETALLTKYLKAIGNCSITLVTFANDIIEQKKFEITNGNSSALETELNNVIYDGGTQLGAINLNKFSADEFLIFTDAISNFGEKEIKLSNKPVYLINSMQNAEHPMMNFIAQKSGGAYINLLTLTDEQAENLLIKRPFSFISAEYMDGDIEETFPSMMQAVKGSFLLTGIIKKPQTLIKLNFGYGTEITQSETIELKQSENSEQTGLLGRIWASKKLAELDMQFEKNKDAITALGKAYNLVTKNTSMIVLDRVEDYARYLIEPPEELKAEYNALIAKQVNTAREDSTKHFEYVLALFEKEKEWWKKEYDTTYHKPKEEKHPADGGADPLEPQSTSSTRHRAANPAPRGSSRENARMQAEGCSGMGMANALAPAGATRNGNTPPPPEDEANSTGGGFSGKVSLKEYNPDAPYYKLIKDASGNSAYAVYLEQKKDYEANPGFYLDAADAFEKRGDTKTALRVLSNIAEMQLENHELLRILGHRLQQLKYFEFAKIVFQDLIKMREEEPQSYRDLALLLADNKEYQASADMLYKMIITKWDGRFSEIELIALNEFNRLITLHKAEINCDKFDKKLIESMPVDIRVVLNWDADACDMDLWVRDPHDNDCSYQQNLTAIGAKMSRDFTRGYGPEEFMLRRAIAGKYKVKANYYGSSSQKLRGETTIQLELYIKYGTNKEEKKEITLRLKNIKDFVDVGEFEFVK